LHKGLAVYLLFCSLLTVIGCDRQRVYTSTLAKADSIIEHNADSAYTLLGQIADVAEQGDEANRAYYILLRTQANFKLYKPVPPDSVIRSAVNYYEQYGNPAMFCRACYYRAMALYEQGQHDEALLLLRTGEQAAIELNDIRQMSKYHESLCMVNDYAGCHSLMLKYAKLFLDDAILLQDTAAMVRGYDHVSLAYTYLKKHEEAKSYIMSTLPLVKKMRKTDQAYILTNLGCTYHTDSNFNAAKYYLKLSLEANPMPNTYAELGNVYMAEGNIQEARKCWNEALKSDNASVIANTLASIANQYKRQNDYANALSVSERLYIVKDSVNQASERTKIAELQYRYDKQVVESKYYKTLTWLFGVIALSLLIYLCAYFYHRHTVKGYTNLLTIKEEAILRAQRQISALESSGEEHSEEISSLQKQIATIRKQTNERLGIGKRIHDNIVAGGHLSSTDDEHCLIEYYSIIHYEAYSQWMREYHGLTARLITILILQDMGKTDTEIQRILSISNGAVRTNKSRIKAKKTAPKKT